MKSELHPTYNESVTVTCSCGHSWQTGSTASAISIEVCSNCHPFYTGKSKLVDATGRVDKFQQRLNETAARQKAKAATPKKSSRKANKDTAVRLS